MNLYRIFQTQNDNYDTYDSAVVAAESEEIARNMNPRDGTPMTEEKWKYEYSSWCNGHEYVGVEFLGIASDTIKPGIIVSSFNAG